MSSTEKPEPTPANVAKLATQEANLPRLALLGVFGSDTAPMALVRVASGDITRVAVGDKLAQGVVQAIGTDRLVLARAGGSTKVLTLPKG